MGISTHKTPNCCKAFLVSTGAVSPKDIRRLNSLASISNAIDKGLAIILRDYTFEDNYLQYF